MHVEGKVTLHNKFKIEVRDAETGQLKQEAEAYNIVLDTMWTRLCNEYSYFTYINFGSGTGTLDPTRSTLFIQEGYKTGVEVTKIRDYDASEWTKKIELAPAEYVGVTISEVGIGYGTTSICTHALLEDSEGTPISITKTALDIVTIYATVYASFSTNDPNIKFIGSASSNDLVGYVIGDADIAGDCSAHPPNPDNQLYGSHLMNSLGDTTDFSLTADVANKKMVTNVKRFEVSNANGPIGVFDFLDIFYVQIPLAGVFTGQPYTAVPVGTGDGVETKFVLPSQNIDQTSITIKLDSVETTAYTKSLERRFNAAGHPNMSSFNDDAMGEPRISRDGKSFMNQNKDSPVSDIIGRVDCGRLTASGMKNYTFASFATNFPPEFRPHALSGDGKVAIGGTTHTTCKAVRLRADESGWDAITDAPGVYYSDPAALNYDGSVLAIGAAGTVYDYVADAWVARAALPVSLNGDAEHLALSDNGNILFVGTDASPFFYSFDWTGTEWVQRPAPSVLPPDDVTHIKCTGDGGTVIVSMKVVSPYVIVYDWSGTEWVKRPDPTLGYPQAEHGTISNDGLMLLVGHGYGNAPYTTVLEWTGSAWQDMPIDPAPPNVRIMWDITENKDMVLLNAYPYDQVWDFSKRTTLITFDTPPGAGVAVTADYTVNGIHKTDQYIIDVSCAITFGEPT